MNTKTALILSLALIISTILYCLGTRYQMIQSSANDPYSTFMYDRLTGKSWAYVMFSYTPTVSTEERKRQIKANPPNPKLKTDLDKLFDQLDSE
jgi:hypothetical protein